MKFPSFINYVEISEERSTRSLFHKTNDTQLNPEFFPTKSERKLNCFQGFRFKLSKTQSTTSQNLIMFLSKTLDLNPSWKAELRNLGGILNSLESIFYFVFDVTFKSFRVLREKQKFSSPQSIINSTVKLDIRRIEVLQTFFNSIASPHNIYQHRSASQSAVPEAVQDIFTKRCLRCERRTRDGELLFHYHNKEKWKRKIKFRLCSSHSILFMLSVQFLTSFVLWKEKPWPWMMRLIFHFHYLPLFRLAESLLKSEMHMTQLSCWSWLDAIRSSANKAAPSIDPSRRHHQPLHSPPWAVFPATINSKHPQTDCQTTFSIRYVIRSI